MTEEKSAKGVGRVGILEWAFSTLDDVTKILRIHQNVIEDLRGRVAALESDNEPTPPESVRLRQFVNDIKAALRPYDITGSNDFSGRTTSEVVEEVIDAVRSLETWEVAHEEVSGG